MVAVAAVVVVLVMKAIVIFGEVHGVGIGSEGDSVHHRLQCLLE